MIHRTGPILLVEDTQSVLDLLITTLGYKGYQIITANNGVEALEKIARQRPAIIVTDIMMPRMDGYTLAHRLRQDPQTRDIPIMFLSATYVSPDDKKFGLGLGAVRFLEKPVDPEQFLVAVAEVLTMEVPDLPSPLDEREFFKGYRERLEFKLRNKTTQIARIERLMESLPPEQKINFITARRQAELERDEVQRELDQLRQLVLDVK